jgi:hypothetical protein
MRGGAKEKTTTTSTAQTISVCFLPSNICRFRCRAAIVADSASFSCTFAQVTTTIAAATVIVVVIIVFVISQPTNHD